MKKIISFISEEWQSYWVKSGFFSLIGRSSNLIFGFATFLVLVRYLGPEDFGTWTLFVSVCTFLDLWKSGFIANPLIRYLSAESGQKYSDIVNASFFLNILISLFQILLIIIFSDFLSSIWNSPELKSMFLIYIGSIIFQVPISHFNYIQQANLNFRGTFLTNLSRNSLFFTLILVTLLLKFDFNLIDLTLFQLFSIICGASVAFLTGKKYGSGHFRIKKKWVIELLNYGKYTFGTNVSSTILRNVDSWMLGYLISPVAVGIYNPAMRMSNLFELPTASLTSIVFPELIKRIKKEGISAAKYLYEKSIGLILAVLLPLVFFVILFAKPIILLIAGSEYMESVPILRITMLYGLIIPLNRQVGITLDALGKAKLTFLFVLRNAIINIVLNYVLISKIGLIGAALATLLTYLLVLIYNQYYIHKTLNIKIHRMIYFIGFFYKQGFIKIKYLLFDTQ